MCWMTIRREHDALANGIAHTRRNEESSGGHSYGYACIEDGEIKIEKDVGQIPDIDPEVTDVALVHTRLATKGEVVEQNAHPFAIRDSTGEFDVLAALAHNGTWYGAPDDGYHSDTWQMAREFERLVQDHEFDVAFEKLSEQTGETCIVLRRTGEVYVYSGRFRITHEGSKVASSGFGTPIPDGTILKIDPDGSVTTTRVETRDEPEVVVKPGVSQGEVSWVRSLLEEENQMKQSRFGRYH